MNKPKMIILADIASLKVTCVGFKQIVKNLEAKYEIVTCKFFSYVAKRNRDYNEYISANGYGVSLPSASRRRNKLDSNQVIEAADIAYNDRIDAVAMISGEGDILPVIDLLKGKGKEVFDINVESGKYNYAYSGFIAVPTSALREGYTAPATKAKAKKAPKPVAPVQKTVNPYVEQARNVLSGSEILSKYRR
ncbi:MAG: NYN domain-containing protein [Clostridia bacterium]|nr:NYN domain-containing protein [Clostridia bacterium]